ncbi:MAG: hypothetical protein [Bacteriophage sp.]|nr:MAG: hypothetical protein [Bacteriophage sp.]
MFEKNKTKIEITDEAIIFIDNLVADLNMLDHVISQESFYLVAISNEGYTLVKESYKDYLKQKDTIETIHNKIDTLEYSKELYSLVGNKDCVDYVAINAASNILGKSFKEIYKNHINRLKETL